MESFYRSVQNLKHFKGSKFTNLSNNINFIHKNDSESLMTVIYKRPDTDHGLNCYSDHDFEKFSSDGGYIYDVFQTLQEVLNIRTNYKIIENGDANTKEIGDMDLLIFHPLTDNFPAHLKMVYPVLHSRLVLLYKSSSLPIEKDLFIRNINGNMWSYLVGVLFLLTICFRLSTFIHHSLRPSHRDWSWLEVVQWSMGAVCQQGSAKHPQGCSCRTMFIIGYLITSMIFTGYAAGITSLLAVRDGSHHLPWDTALSLKLPLVELCDSGCGTYLMNGRANTVSSCVPSVGELLSAVEQSSAGALVSEAGLIHLLTHSVSEETRCQMSFSKQLHHNYYTALAVSEQSPLKHSVYYWLLRLREHGLLKRMSSGSSRAPPACQMAPGYTEVGFEHVRSAFYIITVHMICSFVLLLIEILLHRNGVLVNRQKLKKSKQNKRMIKIN